MPRIPLRYSIPVAFPDCCGLDRVDAALAFTANNDRAWGRRVVASIMSRLTSSDTCNAVFDVVHFGTYARAYAVRQASRSPTAPINGETHTQVRRGVFSTHPQHAALRSQASSQWRWSGSYAQDARLASSGLGSAWCEPSTVPHRLPFRRSRAVLHDVVAIERSGCTRRSSPGARSSRRSCPKGNEW